MKQTNEQMNKRGWKTAKKADQNWLKREMWEAKIQYLLRSEHESDFVFYPFCFL
jgi:hypothetical protein